jgi:hypothetical protein
MEAEAREKRIHDNRRHAQVCDIDGNDVNTDTYVHMYIHTYIHTYIQTYKHTYKHTNIHTYIHTGVAGAGEGERRCTL